METRHQKSNTRAFVAIICGIMLFSLYLNPRNANAQERLTPFKGKVEGGYNFWLHEPDMRTIPNQRIPLILFLHGKSLSGSNLEMVKRYGVLKEVLKRRKLPAYVLAPQCPMGKMWDPKRIIKVVDFIQQNYNTDTTRFYVVGMSMGGYGVLHFAGAYPDRIAAAVALCGGGDIKDGCKLADIPLWIMHGTADRAVAFSESQRMADAIIRCNRGVNLKFDTLVGAGHGEPARFFSMDVLYTWLFSHSKAMVNTKDTLSVDHKLFASKHSKSKAKKAKKSKKVKSGKKVVKETKSTKKTAKKTKKSKNTKKAKQRKK